LGDGGGGFTAAPGSPIQEPNGGFVAVGDFNGDGHSDLVVTGLVVLLGDGTGKFTVASSPQIALPGQPAGSVAVADFNGDGRSDIALCDSGGKVMVLLGDGLGGFLRISTFPTGSGPIAVAAADFNGDGKTDLAVVNQGSRNVTVLLGDGTGNFTPASGSPFAAGAGPVAIAVGDLNGDGYPDLAFPNPTGSNVTVLLGDSAGGFTPAPGSPFSVGIPPQTIVVADFDGDGRLDLAVGNLANSTNSVVVLLGDGHGNFTPGFGSPVLLGQTPAALSVADFNGDGLADLLTIAGGSVSVLPGAEATPCNFEQGGPNTVANVQTVLNEALGVATAVHDLNGDGAVNVVDVQIVMNAALRMGCTVN